MSISLWTRAAKPLVAALACMILFGCGAAKEKPKTTPPVNTPVTETGKPGPTPTPEGDSTTASTDKPKDGTTPPTDPTPTPPKGTATAVSKDSPAAYVANDAFVFVVVRPMRIFNSDVVKGLPPEMVAEALKSFREKGEAPVDVDPTKVDFLTVSVVPDPPKEGEPRFGPPGKPIGVIRSTEPIDEAGTIEKKSANGTPMREASKDGKKYWRTSPAEKGAEENPEENDILIWLDEKTVAFGNEALTLKSLANAGTGTIADRLKTISLDQDVVVVGYPDNDVKRMAGMQAGAALPPEQGEQAAQALEQTKSLLVTVDLTAGNLLGVTVEGTTEEAAAEMEKQINQGIMQLKKFYPVLTSQFRAEEAEAMHKELVAFADKLLEGLSIEKKGSEIAVAVKNPGGWDKFMVTVKPLIEEAQAKAKLAAANTIRRNNLKQIGLAFHNYHDSHDSFPPAKNGPKGKLSWRVHILPFLDYSELYSKFKLDEDWDSENNKPLIEQMPDVFASTGDGAEELAKAGKTRFVGFTGEGAPMGREEGLKFPEVTDGTSNTILAVEAGADKAVIWTKPDDLAFDPKDPLAALGELTDATFNALLMDGSVRGIMKSISPETLKGLITFAGGEVVGDF